MEAVFEIYNFIDYLNQRMARQSVHEWESIPLLEKTLELLEIFGKQEPIENVKKKLEELQETKPDYA